MQIKTTRAVFSRSHPHWDRQFPRNVHRSGLDNEQVFRLWRAAVKDDGALVDDVIHKVYDDMIASDSQRAEGVMELIVRRYITARHEFRTRLQDMKTSGAQNPHEPYAVGRRLDS